MTDKTEYALALAAIEKQPWGYWYSPNNCTGTEAHDELRAHKESVSETIHKALLIADALERGPSEKMILAGIHYRDQNNEHSCKPIFQAMINQMKKEIGDG